MVTSAGTSEARTRRAATSFIYLDLHLGKIMGMRFDPRRMGTSRAAVEFIADAASVLSGGTGQFDFANNRHVYLPLPASLTIRRTA